MTTETTPEAGVKGWIPNAVDINGARTGYAAPYPYGKPDEWMTGEIAVQRGMDPRYLTHEDQDRMAAMAQGAATEEQADAGTFLRAAMALARANVDGASEPVERRRWAVVATKAEEALLYALFGDRV